MNKAVILLSAVSILFFIQSVSAGVLIGNSSINTQYSPNETITGSINISLSNISSDAYFSSNFGQNISLKSLLRQQSPTANYSCSTADCNDSYYPIDAGNSSEDFTLSSGQSQTLGFMVQSGGDGKINSISPNSFFITVTSDAAQSNSPQLSIDLLDDGNPEWVSYQPSGMFTQEFGHYSSTDFTGSTIVLDSVGVCEKITLPISPNVNLEAKDISGSGGQLTMTIRGVNQTNLGTGACSTIPSFGQISCVPNFAGLNYPIMTSGDFYVCISDSSSSGRYSMNIEHNYNPANSGQFGFYAATFPPVNYTTDYPIYAQSGAFAPVGSFILNDTETGNSWYHTLSLESQMSSYLTTKYSNICSNGCVIPITFNALSGQSIQLSGFQLLASTSAGSQVFNSIYNVAKTTATITTRGYQSLSLNNAGLIAPGNSGNATFILTLYEGGNPHEILSKTISIGQTPQISSLIPRTTAAAVPTNFTTMINTFGTDMNITQYQWNFGDGSPAQTTTTNRVEHTYSQIKTYIMQITISNSQGLSSSENFTVDVIAPQDAVNQLLTEDLQNIAKIQDQMKNFPAFAQDAISNKLNLNATAVLIQNLQIKNSSASSADDYLNIMNTLLKISLPTGIQMSSSANSVPFMPSKDIINLDTIKRVGGGTYDVTKKSSYTDSIVAWDLSNASITIDYSEFSANYGTNIVPILDVVKLNILGGAQSLNKVYLFIPNLDNIYFGSDNYTAAGSYYYVPLTGSSQTVQFATTKSLSPVTIPVFVSPSLDQVKITEDNTPSSGISKTVILILILASIGAVGIIIYILIGRWYQKRYESYLFKDRNDLYNIINYIHSAKAKGMKNDDIEKNLRKSTWTSEQVNYIMKRYAGKKVGLLGFTKSPKNQVKNK